MSEEKLNPMRDIRISKLTLNIGAGTDHAHMEKAILLLKMITGIDPVKTKTVKRIATWGLRPGLPIGCKVTLRGKQADDVLQRLLTARDHILVEGCFDNNGNISFGLKEYLDIPGTKYDQKIGIIGLQASVTLQRPGFRIKARRLKPAKISHRHSITKEEAIAFAQEKLSVKFE